MADKNDLKAALRRGVPAGKRQRITEAQISEAADELIKIGSASREILGSVGQKVANDRLIFEATDLDDVVTILDELKD
jgi:hypothetical protein